MCVLPLRIPARGAQFHQQLFPACCRAVLANAAFAGSNGAKLLTFAPGGGSMLHSVINHRFSSVIKGVTCIQLKTTEYPGKGTYANIQRRRAT